MMSIAVRALGIAVILMMAVLAIRLLNEREQLSHNLEDTPRLDKRSRLIWKMKILGSRRKLKQGRLSLGLMMLTFLVGFLTMRAYANEYFFMIGGGISVILCVHSLFGKGLRARAGQSFLVVQQPGSSKSSLMTGRRKTHKMMTDLRRTIRINEHAIVVKLFIIFGYL